MALAGTGALLNWSDVAVEHRADYYEWHVREHMVGRIGVPGFLRGRRYAALRAGCDFFQFYELADTDVLASAVYLALANAPSPLTQRVTRHLRNSCRVVARQRLSVGAGQAGCLLTLRIRVDADAAAALETRLDRVAMADIRVLPLISGVHVLASTEVRRGNEVTSPSGTASVLPPAIVVMVEGLSADALDRAGDTMMSILTADGSVSIDRIERDLFRHEYTIADDDKAIGDTAIGDDTKSMNNLR